MLRCLALGSLPSSALAGVAPEAGPHSVKPRFCGSFPVCAGQRQPLQPASGLLTPHLLTCVLPQIVSFSNLFFLPPGAYFSETQISLYHLEQTANCPPISALCPFLLQTFKCLGSYRTQNNGYISASLRTTCGSWLSQRDCYGLNVYSPSKFIC